MVVVVMMRIQIRTVVGEIVGRRMRNIPVVVVVMVVERREVHRRRQR